MTDKPNCEICGMPMPDGEEMFLIHGYSGSCPAPPIKRDTKYYDDGCIDEFASVMKEKMDQKRAEGRGGWEDPEKCSIEQLQLMLYAHIRKGDPVDVANFAMMLWHRKGSTSIATPNNQ